MVWIQRFSKLLLRFPKINWKFQSPNKFKKAVISCSVDLILSNDSCYAEGHSQIIFIIIYWFFTCEGIPEGGRRKNKTYSPVLSAEQFSLFPTRQQECCEGEDSLCSSGWCPALAPWSPECIWLPGPWHGDETWPKGTISSPSCWHGATWCIRERVPPEKVPLVLL